MCPSVWFPSERDASHQPVIILDRASRDTVQMLNRSINSKHKFRSNYSAAKDKCGPEKLQLNV